MDQHPIPQDVTGFQFKLIGTMTVKQFGYVASGVVTAVILYYLPFHSALAILAKVILVPLCGISGVIIAFVPLEGRPIDVMATNFVKALFSPNQYIYHRQGKRLSFSTVTVSKAPVSKKTQEKTQNHLATPANHHDEKEEKLRALLLSSHDQAKSTLDKKEAAFLNTLSLPSAQNTTPLAPTTAPHKAVPSALPKITNPLQQSPAIKPNLPSFAHPAPPPLQNINQQPQDEKKTQEVSPMNQVPQSSVVPGNPEHKVSVLSQQITEIHAQKQQLEQELSHLKTQLATQKATPAPASIQAAAPAPKAAQQGQPLQDPMHVRTIPQGVTKKVGLPHISDSPNVVVGIVKDPRDNILPNILVEVKDKDGNPVRAFKTNQLGQFVSATPLSPGTYTIELDDPKKQHRFDVIQIIANNQVLLPIEVISHDAREELRKQLFAN